MSMEHRRWFCRNEFSVLAGLLALMGILVPGSDAADPVQEDAVMEAFSTTAERSITQEQLKALVDDAVPAQTKRLLIFGECFGGGFAQSPLFGTANTATMSGSSAGEVSFSGGFHWAAAQGLKPEDGRTAQDVYDAGYANRFAPTTGNADFDRSYTETPTVGGGLPLAGFSLEPIVCTVTGNIRSRHIIVYAGNPTTNTLLDPKTIAPILTPDGRQQRVAFDVLDRNRIKNAFSGQPGTSVHTVGGPPAQPGSVNGTDGWDYVGSFDGLKEAFARVKAELADASDPSREQFILYVSDHGANSSANNIIGNLPANARTSVSPDFEVPERLLSTAAAVRYDPGNIPWFGIFLPADGAEVPVQRGPDGEYIPFHQPGEFVMDVSADGSGPKALLVIDSHFEKIRDDGSDVLGDAPNEGLELCFAIDDDTYFAHLGTPMEIGVTNNTSVEYAVGEVSLCTGALQMGPYIEIFVDDFESGDTSEWSQLVP